ncbi:hypothetical protein ACEYYB_13480 [Paracoccus sp. p4-l81]|uniref:hypothetical protein n=1 Tax=unclassified Paracoccus (in: a-proteobacteria) TaxID=2688777 RepID=UPI0035BA5F0B
MKHMLLAAAIVATTATAGVAGPISNACMKAGRTGNAALCQCIQQAADLTLSRADQRLAASFFRDADRAQKVRASKRDNDSAFWGRYRNFTNTAEAYCQ